MTHENTVPKLVTFDGEARSGKGTVVQATKDYLRDECGYQVMLIDRGQTFRVLVVAAERTGVDMDDAPSLDAFLRDDANVAACVQFVKDVYHMEKSERDALLYTNSVGENSAKVGARPASQDFVRDLTKKWLRDARAEGYDVVLIDGRALESIAREMDDEGLCDYRMGLYFICDPIVGARRTLGYATVSYTDLSADQKADVDALVTQINERNARDHDRTTEPLLRPDAPVIVLPDTPALSHAGNVPLYIVDTSAQLDKEAMSLPIARLVAAVLS